MKRISYRSILILLFTVFQLTAFCQTERKPVYSHADSLRGQYGNSRNWWDVTKYNLYVSFNIAEKTIVGKNILSFKKIKSGSDTLQIDLQSPLILDSCILTNVTNKAHTIKKNNPQLLTWIKDGDAYYFIIPGINTLNSAQLLLYYHGKPTVAKNAPWDGGVVWAKDKKKNPWVSIACQGFGASCWYPCKDHQADEPDSAEMHITCPDTLFCVGNGRLRGITRQPDGTATYDWAVVSPINNYCLIPYIGKYVHFDETFSGEKGNLTMDYWVLEDNLPKAKLQFKDAPRMMKAFEYWFGPYPFYEDGYKLVDAPYLGMEHQSATAYGNGYQNGYYGKDLSGSGWGMKWDFIIVHESGHEWFANNISTKDIADMWVHEGLTNYSEVLFTEYYYGKKAADEYAIGLRNNIENKEPIIGDYNVNNESGIDIYYKASNMIHTIRQVINNDSLFRKILRGLNSRFYHKTVTTEQIENYFCTGSGINLHSIFDQYLRTIQIPVLEYKIEGYTLQYRYTDCIAGLKLPLKINFKGEHWIQPTTEWQTLSLYPEGDINFSVDANFYIKTKKVD